MPGSHADNHDRDKLSRWSKGLGGGNSTRFPVYAVFLVRPEDRYAHDVFREFRSSFQSLGADFQHLVIFGQHGVSSTLLSLLDRLGRSLESLPMLALFSGPSADMFCSLSLTAGDAHGHSETVAGESATESEDLWRGLLVSLGDAAAGEQSSLDLESVPGTVIAPLTNGTMERLVEEVLRRVSLA